MPSNTTMNKKTFDSRLSHGIITFEEQPQRKKLLIIG
jgi:hypothetical protein